MNELQRAAAGMLGRGRKAKDVSLILDIPMRTLSSWRRVIPGYLDEIERVRQASAEPNPYGVLLDALGARRDDGIDWAARLRAATALLEIPDPTDTDLGVPVIHVHELPPERQP